MDMAMVVSHWLWLCGSQVMGELGWDHFRIRSWVAQLKGKNKIKNKWDEKTVIYCNCIDIVCIKALFI